MPLDGPNNRRKIVHSNNQIYRVPANQISPCLNTSLFIGRVLFNESGLLA